MSKHEQSHVRKMCTVCGKLFSPHALVPASLVRPTLTERIVREFPSWSADSEICATDLNRFRAVYIRDLLDMEKGELTALDESVVASIARHETLSSDIDAAFQKDLTYGQRVADAVAGFGGSWTFILSFLAFIAIWIGINGYVLAARPFDAFPFILLNLLLSCLAALQAPIIMMSQNRLEERDRLRSQSDYRINLKAELEIRHLHEKLDYLLRHQWERLMEIQEIQVDLMKELTQRRL